MNSLDESIDNLLNALVDLKIIHEDLFRDYKIQRKFKEYKKTMNGVQAIEKIADEMNMSFVNVRRIVYTKQVYI